MAILEPEARTLLSKVSNGNGLCLDIGGGRAPLQTSIEERGYRYINFDRYGSPDVQGDANRPLPFPDRTFPLVISTHLLEHLKRPFHLCREVYRCLKPGGEFMGIMPFLHPYHDRDYWRLTHGGLRFLLEECGFREVNVFCRTGVLTFFGVLISVLLHKAGLSSVGTWEQNLVAQWESKFSQLHSMKWAHSLIFQSRKSP